MLNDARIKRQHHVAVAAQIFVALIGAYLMAAPDLWGYGGAAAKIERFIGPLIASFATMAAWQVLRHLRRINIGLAVALGALAVSPWPWAYPMTASISDVVAMILVIALSLLPYPTTKQFGDGWSVLWRRA